MKLLTRDFGEIEIDERDIVDFEGAVYGFESYKRFVFLYQEDVSKHFVWLQSVEDPQLCFILVEPELVTDTYTPQIPSSVERMLGGGEYMCWLLVVIKDKFEDSTVNLKSPIIINAATKKAAQIILEEEYPIQHPLLQKKEGDL